MQSERKSLLETNSLFDFNASDRSLSDALEAFFQAGNRGGDLVYLIFQHQRPGISQHVARLATLLHEQSAEHDTTT